MLVLLAPAADLSFPQEQQQQGTVANYALALAL